MKTATSKRLKPTKTIDLTPDDVRTAREYIDRFWVNLERYQPHDEESLIGLPNPYLVPAHDPTSSFNFDEMYYWDSYFMVQGMLKYPEKKQLVMGILENLFSLLQRFKIIPNASRTYLMGRSQPPLLTSFIFDVYEAYKLDQRWLAQAISYAKTEYQTVWMGKVKPHWHQVHEGLSRYFDVNVLHDLAEAESGWDMTTRFNRRCLDYLPVDLNALLYKYEVDFAKAADILGQSEEADEWRNIAKQRALTMSRLMWNKTKGLYFDYDFKKEAQGAVVSVATYYPLWAGMVDKTKAKELIRNLKRFEMKGGLSTTEGGLGEKRASSGTPAQWAYPNGWAPLQFLAVQALEKSGEHEAARRIATKWLKTNLDWFNEHGVFLEKYNVVKPSEHPLEGVYPSQQGFGWTNAVFERFCQDYIDN